MGGCPGSEGLSAQNSPAPRAVVPGERARGIGAVADEAEGVLMFWTARHQADLLRGESGLGLSS